MLIIIKTEALRSTYPLLLNWLEKAFNRNEMIETASFSLRDDDSRLTPSLQRELENWMHKNPGSWRYEQPAAPTPPAPAQAPVEQQIDMQEIERQEKAEIQKAVHRAEAENRLADYERGGLIRDDHNLALITEFVRVNTAANYWSAQIVTVAVQTLNKDLHWAPKTAPAPPPPPEPAQPAEELHQLPNGEMQLPLEGITERELRRASLAQLREREERLILKQRPWAKGFRDSSRAVGQTREDRMPSHRVNF